MPYIRQHYHQLLSERLREPRQFIQVLWGARQAGKTTLSRQVAESLSVPSLYRSADEQHGSGWVQLQWDAGRRLAQDSADGAVLILDEIQKISQWSEAVKRLWDEDTQAGTPLKVLLLGSAQLNMQKGLQESMLGRYELLYLPHWSLAEMQQAFDYSLDDYLLFGGYPGCASLIRQPKRWADYVRSSIIGPAIAIDLAHIGEVRKPALMRQLVELACESSGEIVSYNKILGQLQDAGNTTTLAGYYELLQQMAIAMPLANYAAAPLRTRRSTPKHQVLNNALKTAVGGIGRWRQDDPSVRGRLVESAVGAHLANAALAGECELYYWRKDNKEVDFVIAERGQETQHLIAVEVTVAQQHSLAGLEAFQNQFSGPDSHVRLMLVGPGGNMSLDEMLRTSVSDLLAHSF